MNMAIDDFNALEHKIMITFEMLLLERYSLAIHPFELIKDMNRS